MKWGVGGVEGWGGGSEGGCLLPSESRGGVRATVSASEGQLGVATALGGAGGEELRFIGAYSCTLETGAFEALVFFEVVQ